MSTFFQLLTCLSLTAAIRIRIRTDLIPDGVSWEKMVDELTEQKALWQANSVSEYTYKFSTMCFCMPCYLVDKYVYIVDGVAKDVEFDEESMREWNVDCDDSSLSTPIADNYFSIDYYYDEAISFATKGMNANCSGNSSAWGWDETIYCGGTVTFEYDETLHFPKALSLKYGPMIADGDKEYIFECLTVMDMDFGITTLDRYEGQCEGYEPPQNTSDLCVCTMEYFPYCCDGKTFGNKCHAECADYVVYTDCVQSECDADDGDVIHKPGPKGDGSGNSGDECGCKPTRDYNPYCCDGEVYVNVCAAECASFDVSTDCVASDQCQDLEGLTSKVAPRSVASFIHILSFAAAICALF